MNLAGVEFHDMALQGWLIIFSFLLIALIIVFYVFRTLWRIFSAIRRFILKLKNGEFETSDIIAFCAVMLGAFILLLFDYLIWFFILPDGIETSAEALFLIPGIVLPLIVLIPLIIMAHGGFRKKIFTIEERRILDRRLYDYGFYIQFFSLSAFVFSLVLLFKFTDSMWSKAFLVVFGILVPFYTMIIYAGLKKNPVHEPIPDGSPSKNVRRTSAADNYIKDNIDAIDHRVNRDS